MGSKLTLPPIGIAGRGIIARLNAKPSFDGPPDCDGKEALLVGDVQVAALGIDGRPGVGPQSLN
jgi:hypothetical protein